MNIKDTLPMWEAHTPTIPFTGADKLEHEEFLLRCAEQKNYVLLASLIDESGDE